MAIMYSNQLARQMYYGGKRITKAFAGDNLVYTDPSACLWNNRYDGLAVVNGRLYRYTEEIGDTNDWIDAGLRKNGTAYKYWGVSGLLEIDNGEFWQDIRDYMLISKEGELYASYFPPKVDLVDTSDVAHAPWKRFLSPTIIEDSDGNIFYYPGWVNRKSVLPLTLPSVGAAVFYAHVYGHSNEEMIVANGNIYQVIVDYDAETVSLQEYGNLNDGKWSSSFALSVGIHDGELMHIGYKNSDNPGAYIVPLKEVKRDVFPDVPSDTKWVSVSGVWGSPAVENRGTLFAVTEQGDLWRIGYYDDKYTPATAKFPGNNWYGVIQSYSSSGGSGSSGNYTYAITIYGEVYYVTSRRNALNNNVEFTMKKLV